MKALIQQFYPDAKITLTEDEIKFEDKTREFTVHDLQKNGEWSMPFTRWGPDRGGWKGPGGIIGSIRLWKGPYRASRIRPSTADYHYYKELLLAPYSQKHVIMIGLLYRGKPE